MMKTIFYKAIAILFLIGFANHCISRNVATIDNKFTGLTNKIYELSWANEKLIRDYAVDKTNKSLIQTDAKEVRLALYEVIKSGFNAGHTLSKNTFCKIVAYAIMDDSLLGANDSINPSKLISLEKNTDDKHDLLFSITKDNADYHNILRASSTVFGDDSVKKYSKKTCD